MKLKLNLFLFFLSFISLSLSFAQKSWDGGALTNNWGDGANWNPDGVPDAIDAVQVGGGYSILVNIDANCASLTFLSSLSNSSVTIASGITLNISGNISFSDPSAGNVSQTINVNDGTLNCAGISLANTSGLTETNNLLLNNGTINIASDIVRLGAANENFITVSGTGTINIGGNFGTGATLNPGTGTINFNGPGNQNIPAYTFYNVSSSVGGTKTLTANTIINGNLNVGVFSAFNPNTNNLTVTGNTIIEGTFADANAGGITNLQDVDLSGGIINGGATGVININGNLSLPTGDGTIGRTALTVTGPLIIPAGRILTFSDINGAKIFSNDVTIDGTWNNSGNSTITFGGNLTVNNTGSYTSGTGTHTFTGTLKTIGGTLGSLTFPAVAVTGSVTNNISCSLTGLTGAGSWTQSDNSTLNVSGVLGITTLSATTNGNTVNYNGAVAQNVGAYVFHNLQLSGGNVKTLTGNVTVNNDFQIAALTSCNPNTSNLTVLGNTTINGTLADGNVAGITSFQDVDLSGGTINGGANGIININGNLTLPSADAVIGRTEITVTGSLNVPAGISLNISNANGIKTFNGDVTIDGAWNNSGNSAITFGGNLTVNNTGSYTSGTGTHTFTGTLKTIGGTLGSLTFPAVAVTGSVTNYISCSMTGLTGTGSWTQSDNSTLNVSGALGITTFNATATGNTVNYNGAGAQNIYNTDYFNLQVSGGNIKTQLNNLHILSNLTVFSGTTYNIGTVGTNLIVDDNLQIDGILLFNNTTTKNVTITGDLSGTGTINMSGGNLPHLLNLSGSSNS